MEDTINLRELLQILKKRLLLILTITIIAGVASGLVSYFYLTPIYQSSTKLLINQHKDDQMLNSADVRVQADLQLIDTYNEIIKSARILNEVAEKLNSGITAGQLNGQITILKSDNSQVVTIMVRDTSAVRAAEIAYTTAEVFQTEIVKIMKVDNVSILDSAIVNSSPVDPDPIKNIAIAVVIGLVLGIGLAFLLDYFDNTLKNEQDVEKELGLPVLGNIAIIDEINIEKRKERRAEKKSGVRGENIGS